jgi:hypothetical protein
MTDRVLIQSAPNPRHLTRLTLEDTCVQVIDVESGVEFFGAGLDLSSEGLAFRAPLEPCIGAEMQVVLNAKDERLAPLRAHFRVLRVTPASTGGWDVAGTLNQECLLDTATTVIRVKGPTSTQMNGR